MTFMKSGSPFLYNETTRDIVGIKDADGGEAMFAVAETNPLTDRIELVVDGVSVISAGTGSPDDNDGKPDGSIYFQI